MQTGRKPRRAYRGQGRHVSLNRLTDFRAKEMRARSLLSSFFTFAACLLPQTAWTWCHLDGFALGRGKRLYLLKTGTALDCSSACKAVSRCTHWSFDSGRHYCILRSEDPTNKILIRKQDDAISATKDCLQALSCTSSSTN